MLRCGDFIQVARTEPHHQESFDSKRWNNGHV